MSSDGQSIIYNKFLIKEKKSHTEIFGSFSYSSPFTEFDRELRMLQGLAHNDQLSRSIYNVRIFLSPNVDDIYYCTYGFRDSHQMYKEPKGFHGDLPLYYINRPMCYKHRPSFADQGTWIYLDSKVTGITYMYQNRVYASF